MSTVCKLPTIVEETLNNSGIPWSIEKGKKHYKIRLNGSFVAVTALNPRRKAGIGDSRDLALLTSVKRAIKKIKEAKNHE